MESTKIITKWISAAEEWLTTASELWGTKKHCLEMASERVRLMQGRNSRLQTEFDEMKKKMEEMQKEKDKLEEELREKIEAHQAIQDAFNDLTMEPVLTQS